MGRGAIVIGLAAVIIGEVVLGVQIEPLASVQAQVAGLRTATAPAQTSTALVPASAGSARPAVATKVLAQRIIQNAFDFLSSFKEPCLIH